MEEEKKLNSSNSSASTSASSSVDDKDQQEEIPKSKKDKENKVYILGEELKKFMFIISICDFASIGLKLDQKDDEIRIIIKLVVDHILEDNIEAANKEGADVHEVFDNSKNFKHLNLMYPNLKDYLMIIKNKYEAKDVTKIMNEMIEKEKEGRSMLELLKFIDFYKIDIKVLEIITETLKRSGKYLPYEDYSTFKFQYFHRINQRNLKEKKKSKYDTLQYLECGVGWVNSGRGIAIKAIQDINFWKYKINHEDFSHEEEKRGFSKIEYDDLNKGTKPINNEEYKADIDDINVQVYDDELNEEYKLQDKKQTNFI